MSKNDTGIDACNLVDMIVQCKLRKEYLNWGDCSTFFASQNIYNKELKLYARALRTESVSKAEKYLWSSVLKSNKIGVKFNRQRPIDHFIVDFCCNTTFCGVCLSFSFLLISS